MTGDIWPRVKDLIAEAVDLPAEQREDFVRKRCDDPLLLEEALSFLRDFVANTGSTSLKLPLGLILDDSQDEVPLGSQVGPYLVVDHLGQGGMARVYLGRDLRLQRRVALKCLLTSGQLAEERARILREARAAAQISHSNVATIHDIIEHADRAFIVMEYLDGDDLTALIRGPRLPIERVLSIGRQLASALAAAHAKGVIHRDLKPGNVKVLKNGTVKIMDFGIAGLTGAHTTMTAPNSTAPTEATRPAGQPGTPGYMAPEQLGTAHFDARSDLFSLGIVLFEMATGEPAYPDRQPEALVAAMRRPVRRADAASSHVPRLVADVIARAVALQPSERYASAEALEMALGEVERAVIVAETTKTPMGTYSLSPVPPAPLTWRRALRGAAPWVLPAIAVVWALGELSTAVFNLTVGRDHEFRAEIWYSSLDYGRKALLAPVLYVSATIALWWAAGFVVRLVRFLPVCDRVLGALERWIGAIAARLKLDEAKSLGQAATAVAVAVIGGLVWAFRDLLQACATELPNARSEAVGLLATGHLGVIYRYGLVTVLLMLGVATVKIVRMSDRSRAGRLASLAPVLVTALVAVLLVQFPYRLLFNRKAPMVSVRGEGCYVLGQNGNRVQVFCPARPEDRTEVVELSKDVRLLDQSGELFDPW